MTANANASMHRPLNADDLHVLKFIAADTAVDLALYGVCSNNAFYLSNRYPCTSARTITTFYSGGSIGAALVLHDHNCDPNIFLSRSIPLLRKIRSRYTSAATKPEHPDECDCHDQLRLERRCARLASVVLVARQPHCQGNSRSVPLREHMAPLVPLRRERKREQYSCCSSNRASRTCCFGYILPSYFPPSTDQYQVIDCALTIATLDSPFSDIHVFGSIAFHIAGIYPTCVLFVAIQGPTESLISAQVSQAMRFEGPAERPREAGALSDSTPGSSAGVLDIGRQDSHVDSLSHSHLVGIEGGVGVEN
ncbi:hypothetical protein EV714DRAFT_287069 [Schizophyllum commune]